jgi:hypothetical protein
MTDVGYSPEIGLPQGWPKQTGYQMKVTPVGDRLEVTFAYPPKPTIGSRQRRRNKRYLRLVIRAGVESIRDFKGAPVNAETRDAILDAMLPALRKAGERYRHLKT